MRPQGRRLSPALRRLLRPVPTMVDAAENQRLAELTKSRAADKLGADPLDRVRLSERRQP